VIDSEGNSFERSAITEWLDRRGLSPLTRTPMDSSCLVPNRVLKDLIEAERANLPRNHPDGRVPLDVNAPEIINIPDAQLFDIEITSISTKKILISENNDDYDDDDLIQRKDNESFVMTNIIPPANTERVPTDIVVCIDVSGSMGMEATAQGVESSGLNMLDIVKHAVKTIIKTLNDNDRLSIVSYSNRAKKVCELISMTENGKANAIRELEKLREDGT
jgi:hypothetical protein